MEAHEIKIDREFRDLIPPLTNSEEDQLEQNIMIEGIRDPLVVWDETLVDGHHRLEIAKKRGLKFNVVKIRFASRNDAIIWIVKNQIGRRNLESIDKVALVLRMEGALKEKAKAQQIRKPSDSVSANSPEQKPIDVREEVAAAVNMGSNTYSKAKKVLANSTPQQIQAIRDGDASIHSRFVEINEEQQKKQREIEEAAKKAERDANDAKEARELGDNEEKKKAYFEEQKKKRAEQEAKQRDDNFRNNAGMWQLKAITYLQNITDDNPYLNEAMDQIIAWCETNKQ